MSDKETRPAIPGFEVSNDSESIVPKNNNVATDSERVNSVAVDQSEPVESSHELAPNKVSNQLISIAANVNIDAQSDVDKIIEEVSDMFKKTLLVNNLDPILGEFELNLLEDIKNKINEHKKNAAAEDSRKKLIVYISNKHTDYASAEKEIIDTLYLSGIDIKITDSDKVAIYDNLKKVQVKEEAPASVVAVKADVSTQPKTEKVDVNYKPEFSEMTPSDPTVKYVPFVESMAGPNNLLAGFKNIIDFENNLIKEDGVIKYRSEDEEYAHTVIKNYLHVAPPVIDSEGNMAFNQYIGDDKLNQSPTFNGKTYGPKLLKNSLTGVMKIINSRGNVNIPTMIFLPATGILIKARSPTETEICNFDIEFTLETSAIGMSSYGLMLSSSSGVYLKHMLNHALNFITHATIDVGDNNLKQVLYNVIDSRDYWLVLLAPLIAKFPGGFPWYTACTSDNCDHYDLSKLNIARCIRYADYKLSQSQFEIVEKQTQKELADAKLLKEYHDAHASTNSSFTDNDLKVTVNFKHCTLSEYIDSTDSWIDSINRATTEAMSTKATELEREQHLKLCAENNRLLRYKHAIKSISVEDNDGVLTNFDDEKNISDFLSEMSSNSKYSSDFETAYNKFQEDSRLAIFGYMAFPCPKCGVVSSEYKEGKFRGIVPISPDRLFYSLSRAVYVTQRWIMKQSENAG